MSTQVIHTPWPRISFCEPGTGRIQGQLQPDGQLTLYDEENQKTEYPSWNDFLDDGTGEVSAGDVIAQLTELLGTPRMDNGEIYGATAEAVPEAADPAVSPEHPAGAEPVPESDLSQAAPPAAKPAKRRPGRPPGTAKPKDTAPTSGTTPAMDEKAKAQDAVQACVRRYGLSVVLAILASGCSDNARALEVAGMKGIAENLSAVAKTLIGASRNVPDLR